MPVLNGARFIKGAIASIEAQTCEDWELIIVDGGSTDGSLETASAFAQKDQRISLIAGTDAGIYDAVFKGAKSASGDWFSWLNSDDLYTPWCLATVKEFVEAAECQWLIGYSACWDENGLLRYARPSGLYPRRLIAAGWFHSGLLGCLQQESMFFSRGLFEKLAPEELKRVAKLRYAGDFLLWRLFARHSQLETLPSVLGGFRRHGANLSSIEAEAYEQEVRTTAPFAPPAPIAGMIAAPFRLASSWAMMRAAGKADARLAQSLPQVDRS